MKGEPTKAPWEYSDGSIWGKSQWNARVRLATVHRHASMNGIDSDSNGEMMAQAPKMAAALKQLAGILTYSDNYNGSDMLRIIKEAFE